MSRRVISLWLPRLATDRLRRRNDDIAADRPLVLTADARGRRLVVAVDGAAGGAGLTPGMTLADARALAPNLAVRSADPAGEARTLARLAEWCLRFTPWTACEGRDGIWLDVAGCAHLFGGERAMLDDLLRRMAGAGLAVRAGLAATPGAAWALARHGDGAAIAAATATRTALAPLPVAGLRLSPAVVEGLNRLGLRRIGDLYAMPRAALEARFGSLPLGEGVSRRLDQALGRVAEPISPRRPVAPFRARRGFAEPIGHADDIARGLEGLLVDLCRQLARAGRGARRLELTLFRVDGTVRRAAVGTARAARDPDHLGRLFAEQLDRLDSGFGIETMTLAATASEPLSMRQTAMADAAGGAEEPLSALLDRLGNRLGFEQLGRLHARESHLPDRAQQVVPVTVPAPRSSVSWTKMDVRPFELLREAEPLQPLTPMEDATPPTRFQWRGRPHAVRRMSGPERISPEWWHRDPAWAGGARDYWRIESADGRRLWLYRGTDSADPDWFVHGMFA